MKMRIMIVGLVISGGLIGVLWMSRNHVPHDFAATSHPQDRHARPGVAGTNTAGSEGDHAAQFLTLPASESAPDSETETSYASWRTYTAAQGGYSFKHPPSWSVEAIPDANGILVICPTVEADWQANLFFEIRSDSDSRSVGTVLEDLIPNLRKEKTGFSLVSSNVATHPSGLEVGQIEYTHNSDGTKLFDCDTIVVLEQNKLLFVLSSTASSVKQKYNPTFLKIIDSIKKQ